MSVQQAQLRRWSQMLRQTNKLKPLLSAAVPKQSMKLQKSCHGRNHAPMQLPEESPIASISATGSQLFSLCSFQPGCMALPCRYPLWRLSLVPFQAGCDLALGPTATCQIRPSLPSQLILPMARGRPCSHQPAQAEWGSSRWCFKSTLSPCRALFPRREYSKLYALYLPTSNLCFLCWATLVPEIN